MNRTILSEWEFPQIVKYEKVGRAKYFVKRLFTIEKLDIVICENK